MVQRELDIILFGATGFTGKHAVPIVAKFSKTCKYSWGVAGRSEQKLKDLLIECSKETGDSFSAIPIIVANVDDENSLSKMARKTKIIINCCGPYRFFGEQVIKACIQESTHHVDVSGEPQYMEKMQLEYHEKAKEKGIFIVSACGWDSIPADMGVVFLENKFDGVLNSIVTYANWSSEGQATGPSINYGTWESAVYGLAHANELGPLRRRLFKNKLPTYKPKLHLKAKPHKSDLVEGWSVPFLGSDKSVIKRSQYCFYESEKKRPVQVETYMTIGSLWHVVVLSIFGLLFQTLVKYEFGRNLLLKYPKIFSGGLFSHEQPSEEKIRNSRFKLTLYGEGWKEKLSDLQDQYTTPPNTAICATVQGANPGYGATCISLVLSALTILSESDRMPAGGGVYPPGYAFAKTSLIDKLHENEVTFDVVFEKNLIGNEM